MEFLESPNLPSKRVKGVLLDYRTGKTVKQAYKQLGLDLYFSGRVDGLGEAVCGHPDMSLHHLGGRDFVCEPSLYFHYKQMFSSLNLNLAVGNSRLTSTYPYDIAYNVARIGTCAFHKFIHTDTILAEALSTQRVKMLSVQQGYSKCNICFVSQNAFITEDMCIYNIAVKNGFDVFHMALSVARLGYLIKIY